MFEWVTCVNFRGFELFPEESKDRPSEGKAKGFGVTVV